MTDTPSSEEVALWQRRLAAQANNRAWRLSESLNRSPQEDEKCFRRFTHLCVSGNSSATPETEPMRRSS